MISRAFSSRLPSEEDLKNCRLTIAPPPKKNSDRRRGKQRDKDRRNRKFSPKAVAKPTPAGPGAKPALSEGPQRIVGKLVKAGSGWRLQSANRRERGEFALFVKTRFELEEGQLALAEILPAKHGVRNRSAKLLEVIGDSDAPRAVSLIAIATHEIPTRFSKEALDQAEAARPVTLEGPPVRTDLRAIPLVTIDGADARDFDDAVFAEKDGEGWHLIVAIADVAHYVTPDSPLDKTAYERGNSVYFPDRVVPMLPEALSNELCSLKPNVDRACMAVHMWIDRIGEMTRWQFVRGLMRSKARLTYEQAQAAMDGRPDDVTSPLIEPVLKPLYGAFRTLLEARGKRGTLELDLPERKVAIDEEGRVKSVTMRERLDSHRLIEEFMISANVAAAAQLEGKGGVCLYRVHDRPSETKIAGLRDFLDTLGISLVPGRQLHPRFLTQILEKNAGGPNAQVINEVMLRSQAQATYSPANIGHFGLALAKYAHFTSPIRRYADLIVHRGLIKSRGLGADGLTDEEALRLQAIADHISTTERRAAAAERDALDRYVTLFMADHVGASFPGRISGVARFGLFARLDLTGADGIIPISRLPNDFYFHDEKRQALVGKRSGRIFQLGQAITVRLEEADRLTGGLSFSIVDPSDKSAENGKSDPQPSRGRRNDRSGRPQGRRR